MASNVPRKSRPRRKRGIAWFTIFVVVFAVTTYLIRERDAQRPDNANQADSVALQDGKGKAGSDLAAPPFLTRLDDDRWRSPAGLIYGPGSREGHRLKHLSLHLKDNPEREIHGVFEAEGAFDRRFDRVLQWIDQAYRMHRNDDPQVRSTEQGQRTRIDADLDEEIGYVGGQDGRREGNPKTSRIRVILEDESVITAYPIWPPR